MHRFNLPRRTVTDIVDRFICLGSPYTELGKQRRPSIYGMEIQKHLIENQGVEQQRFIESLWTRDLGYSCKKLTIVPKESL